MQFLNIGPGEMILILVIALVVFGPGKLPEIGRSVGRGINEFRRATTDLTREFSQSIDDVKQPFDDLKGAVTGTAAKTPAAIATVYRPNCSAVNPASNKFCKECGGRMVQDEATVPCSACAAVNPVSNKFCKECGAAIVLPEPVVAVSEDASIATPDANGEAAPVIAIAEATQGAEAVTEAGPNAETASEPVAESETVSLAEPVAEASEPLAEMAETEPPTQAEPAGDDLETPAADAASAPASVEEPIDRPGSWYPAPTGDLNRRPRRRPTGKKSARRRLAGATQTEVVKIEGTGSRATRSLLLSPPPFWARAPNPRASALPLPRWRGSVPGRRRCGRCRGRPRRTG